MSATRPTIALPTDTLKGIDVLHRQGDVNRARVAAAKKPFKKLTTTTEPNTVGGTRLNQTSIALARRQHTATRSFLFPKPTH